ncbi:Protein GL2-INTERACTING REPRESSOR 2 [Linum grandiflorum]
MGRRTGDHNHRQAASCPQLDLRLNLSPPPDNHYYYGDDDDDDRQVAADDDSPVRSTCSSWESSCVQNSSTEEVTTTTTTTPSPAPAMMMLVGCPRCLMYVMLSEVDPKCPKCKSSVLLHDFVNHDQHHQVQPSSSTIFPN